MTAKEYQAHTIALLEKIRDYLEKRRNKNTKLREENAFKNRGLEPGYIATEQGRINDAHYGGRIALLNQLIEKVDILIASEQVEEVE